MQFRQGRKVGANMQDFSVALSYRESAGHFAQDYLGYVRVPVFWADIFSDPANPVWTSYFVDRQVDWSIQYGVPILFMIESVPLDSVQWRTLAGHAGSALTNRDGSTYRLDDYRYARPEEALWATIAQCNQTLIDRIAARYEAAQLDPADMCAVQWWNEPFLDDPSEPGEFNRMSNTLVPLLKATCQGHGIELWSPPIGGGFNSGGTHETQIATSLSRIIPAGTNPVFKTIASPSSAAHWAHYDAIAVHSPYLWCDAYPIIDPAGWGKASGRKVQSDLAAIRSALTGLGMDASRPIHATECGFGRAMMGAAVSSNHGRVMDDDVRGLLVRRQVEAALAHCDSACVYLLTQDVALDYPSTDLYADFALIRSTGQWTKAARHVAALAGVSLDSPKDDGSWPADWASDARGATLTVTNV